MTVTQYTRDNPSPRFRELEAMYRQLHAEGDQAHDIAAADMFDGRSLMPHVQVIGNCLHQAKCKSLLDYGCGKGSAYEKATAKMPDGRAVHGLKAIWGLDEIRLYDPGHAPYSEYPTGQFDAVISTDVMEHIPADDVPWVVREIFGFARKFVFINVACYPAVKTLPDGTNAHITQESPGWWLDTVHAVKQPDFHAVRAVLVIDDADKKRIVVEL